MKIVCYARSAHQVFGMDKFITGLECHGISCEKKLPTEYQQSDLAVFWGHKERNIIAHQIAAGKHYLVMERGYMGDRFVWTSLGFDGLNGRAKFPKIDDGLKRWNKHFSQHLKPWKKPEGKIAVIMGQVRGDEAVRHIDFQQWVLDMKDLLDLAGFSAMFRPHPGEPCYRPPKLKLINGSLNEALWVADLAVTYNSNSGVDSVLAGVPTYAADFGSMVKELSEPVLQPSRPDRTAWQKKMAYTQWLPEEINRGDAWDALRTVI